MAHAAWIDRAALEFMHEEARRAYPGECCGVLEGVDDATSGRRRIVAARRVPNATTGRRFRITAEALRAAEQVAEGGGNQVVGFYHSHPDAPTRPSRTDLDGAWPWYTYVIVPASRDPDRDGARDVARAWSLSDDRSVFHQQRIEESES